MAPYKNLSTIGHSHKKQPEDRMAGMRLQFLDTVQNRHRIKTRWLKNLLESPRLKGRPDKVAPFDSTKFVI